MMEWQIVNFNTKENNTITQKEILSRLMEQYRAYDGVIFPASSQKIVMIIRMGIVENFAAMKSDIEKKIPGHSCRVLLRKMSTLGMKQVQIDLTQKNTSISLIDDLYIKRAERKENVILIADDDAFIRKSMKTLLSNSGRIEEVDNGKDVVKAYLKHNPDLLLLDIHMPERTGLEVISDIMEVDADAFVIVLSADSCSENVIKSLDKGAAGFLTKPPAKDKVKEYLSQCITMAK